MTNKERDHVRHALHRLREVQKYLGGRAREDVFDARVRAAYFDAETRLSIALGELDWIANQEVKE